MLSYRLKVSEMCQSPMYRLHYISRGFRTCYNDKHLKGVVESKIQICPMVEQVLVSQWKVFLIVKRVLFSHRKVSANLFGSKRLNILTHINRTFVLSQPNILLILPNICAL